MAARMDHLKNASLTDTPRAAILPACAAVMVTYHPGPDTVLNAGLISSEFGRLIVVDNGSTQEELSGLRGLPGVEILELGSNQGIAHALNRGASLALEAGLEWVVTFDQDSTPSPGFARAILECGKAHPMAAVIGACLTESALGCGHLWLRAWPRFPLFFERVALSGHDLPGVTMVITSGALTRLAAWKELGGFDEALFIDYVDTDFCLRCRQRGLSIVVCSGAVLLHRLGKREARRLVGMTFHPTHHVPVRHYTIARNRIRMLARHAWRTPHWLLFEMCVLFLWLLRVACFEQHRLLKFKAMVLGTWDGLLGRAGPVSSSRRSSLSL